MTLNVFTHREKTPGAGVGEREESARGAGIGEPEESTLGV